MVPIHNGSLFRSSGDVQRPEVQLLLGRAVQEACASEFARACVVKEDGVQSDHSTDSCANDNTCAICLNHIAGSETAQPDCCEHIYCSKPLPIATSLIAIVTDNLWGIL